MKNVLDFQKAKREGNRITMVTCYDTWSARLINATSIDCVLVGDSLAMVVHGHPTTLAASTELMALHVAAVARGAPDKFIVGDMPFLSYRKGLAEAMECVDRIMKAGAHSVKLEGIDGHEEIARHIVQSGVPVMGHLGLTPQSVHQLGGMRVQGREANAEEILLSQARKLEEAGCFAVVLECMPSALAAKVTRHLRIPTIGIGAGPECSGQVLVLQDMLGMNPEFKPKFLKTYLNGAELVVSALNTYDREVKGGVFPTEKESYT